MMTRYAFRESQRFCGQEWYAKFSSFSCIEEQKEEMDMGGTEFPKDLNAEVVSAAIKLGTPLGTALTKESLKKEKPGIVTRFIFLLKPNMGMILR